MAKITEGTTLVLYGDDVNGGDNDYPMKPIPTGVKDKIVLQMIGMEH